MLGISLMHTLESTADSEKPVTLNTKIHDIIPLDFVTTDEYTTSHASLKDALYHRLGLPRHDLSYGGPDFTVRDTVRSFRHLPMTAELRERFQYCNMGYHTLQHVIETITGKFCGDVYDEAIFKPLGMSSSTVSLAAARESPHGLAVGYTDGKTVQPWANSRMVGGGGVISSARDMAAYLRGMISNTLPISDDSHAALLAPGIIGGGLRKGGEPELYAAGWVVTAYRGHRFVQHGGAVPGFASFAGFLPDKNWGAVVLTNGDLDGVGATKAVFYRLMDEFLGVPADERRDFMEEFGKMQKGMEEGYLKTRERLFPDAPSPPLPSSLPLEDYTGTYRHPAYQSITFSAAKPDGNLPVAADTKEVLHADKSGNEWCVVLDLEHISGDHFVCYVNTVAKSPMVKLMMGPRKAEFRVGPDGKVARVGIEFLDFVEEKVPGENKIWFERV